MKKDNSTLDNLKKELETEHNQYLRALADYQNLEKRSQASTQNEVRRVMVGFLKGLVEIANDLEHAETFHKDAGLRLIKSKFDALLARYQVREINPLNQEFSPLTMECIQTEKGLKANVVTKVLEKGYLYENELLHPAKVVVSKLEVPETSRGQIHKNG